MINKKAKNKIIKSRGVTTGTWPAHYCTLEVGGAQIKGENPLKKDRRGEKKSVEDW